MKNKRKALQQFEELITIHEDIVKLREEVK